MAKVNFTKVIPVKKVEPKEIDINGATVVIEQYLPISEKAAFAERVINAAIDPNITFASASRMAVYFAIELIKTYTNINLTDKLLQEPNKVYDLLVINGVLEKVIDAIPEEEYNELYDKTYEDQEHVESFMHSFLGVMNSIQSDYSQTAFNIENLLQTVKDPTALNTLKDILEKIG